MADPGGPVAENEGAGADRRREILRAAVAVFSEKGYHGTRIADVATEAGVAYGLVYHYFRNKEELLQSVFTEVWERFAVRLGELAKADLPLATRVDAIVSFAFDAYRADPRALRVLILEVARTPAFRESAKRTAFEEAIGQIRAVIEGARASGELRRDVDPYVAACILFGSVEILLTAFVLGQLDPAAEADFERARTTAVSIFLGGVGA